MDDTADERVAEFIQRQVRLFQRGILTRSEVAHRVLEHFVVSEELVDVPQILHQLPPDVLFELGDVVAKLVERDYDWQILYLGEPLSEQQRIKLQQKDQTRLRLVVDRFRQFL